MKAGSVFARINAVLMKEVIQMRRDRLTFAMIIGIPIIQLVLFGYAINTDPKRLPTGVIVSDPGPVARAIVAGMMNSDYFDIELTPSERAARQALDGGDLAFVVTIPTDFHADLARGRNPQVVVEADASDPAASANAVAAMPEIVRRAVASASEGPLARAASAGKPAVEVVIHRLYNPEAINAYNIVPGLLGTILTMTTTLMTALALSREIERGTMENLLAMPVRPVEIMVGKILPYIGLGFLQVLVILSAAFFLFRVPMEGSFTLLLGAVLLFIAANVTLGYTFSTLARTQMQAMQMTFFFFLPSILLSGFMFPFRGMPEWAQVLGQILPLTHFLRAVRGIMLKGSDLPLILPNLWPIALFLLAIGALALLRFRRTLD
jgi:ABC-2 type transport system permease protein